MSNKFSEQDYYTLQGQLVEIEKATGLYLADENVDVENVGELPPYAHIDASDEDFAKSVVARAIWWDRLYRAATMAAGQRAADYGKDINVLLGRVIY